MGLTARWTQLDKHAVQQQLVGSDARFRVVTSGRRSGKTELGKRKLVVEALRPGDGLNYYATAPTRQQAKRLYWNDLKALIPPQFVGSVSETDLTIRLRTGNSLTVMGMDKPERIEGDPIDGIVLDEYANMKESAWTEHVRPGLTTRGRRPGWAWFIGVPEGRNHYYRRYQHAKQSMRETGVEWVSSWAAFSWPSADILPASEIDAARHELDERTFRQEYEGSFESFQGLAYYAWSDDNVVKCAELYDPDKPLILCFDFNTRPGTASVLQEVWRRIPLQPDLAEEFTAVIDEVWRESGSRTPFVVSDLLANWKWHPGEVHCYGDPSGGAQTTQSVDGSDWDIIEKMLRPVFGDRLYMKQALSAPAVRARLNATNSRIRSSSGHMRLVVDPQECPHTIQDFEGCETDDAGQLVKPAGTLLTHLTDGIGYYLAEKHPISGGSRLISQTA